MEGKEYTSQAVLGAVLSSIDINPVNLLKLKDTIPEEFVTKHILEVGLKKFSHSKDIPAALAKQWASDSNLNASIDSMICRAILSLDLLMLADVQQVKSNHPYFLQACNSLRKGIKQTLSVLFKEILSTPQDNVLSDFLEFLYERVFPSRVISQIATIENFLVTLLYTGRQTDVATHALGVLWSSSNAKNIPEELCENIKVILDKLLSNETGAKKSNGSKKEKEDKIDMQKHESSDRNLKEKMESLALPDYIVLEELKELKFRFATPEILIVISKVMIAYFKTCQSEGSTVDMSSIINCILKIRSLTVEDVAFSDKLRKTREIMQHLSIELVQILIATLPGSFYDLFSCISLEFPWRSPALQEVTQYLELLTEQFCIFPKSYHIQVIFEEPNLLYILPKLLVSVEKRHENQSTSLLKPNKHSNTNHSSQTKFHTRGGDWTDLISNSNTPEQIASFRTAVIEYLVKFSLMTSSTLVYLLSPAHQARLSSFTVSLFQYSKLLIQLPRVDCKLISELSENLGVRCLGRLRENVEDLVSYEETEMLMGFEVRGITKEWVTKVLNSKQVKDDDLMLGKRRDWDEYFQTLLQDTKSKLLKQARYQIADEAKSLVTEEQNNSMNVENSQQTVPNQLNSFKHGFGAYNESTTHYEQDDDTFAAHHTHYISENGRNTHGSATNILNTQSIKTDELAITHKPENKIPSSVTNNPVAGSAFTKKAEVSKKSQLFDSSDSEDEPSTSKNNVKEAAEPLTFIAKETQQQAIQEADSTEPLLVFSDLTDAPTFGL